MAVWSRQRTPASDLAELAPPLPAPLSLAAPNVAADLTAVPRVQEWRRPLRTATTSTTSKTSKTGRARREREEDAKVAPRRLPRTVAAAAAAVARWVNARRRRPPDWRGRRTWRGGTSRRWRRPRPRRCAIFYFLFLVLFVLRLLWPLCLPGLPVLLSRVFWRSLFFFFGSSLTSLFCSVLAR